MKTKTIRVPAHLEEQVRRYVDRQETKGKLKAARAQLDAIMSAKHPAGVQWVHAEITYAELTVPFVEFLDSLGASGWALAAMGPRSFVLRNRLGGRPCS